MDDKLVSLEAVKRTLEKSYYGEATLGELLEDIDNITAASRPMSADEYLWQRERMCHSFDKATYDPRIDACEDCPLIDCCSKRGRLEGAEAVDIVEAWAKANPEERSEE